MKKLILTSLAAVAVMSASCFATLSPEKEASKLTLDNVDALSSNEVVIKDCDGGKDICDAVASGSTLYIFTYN